MASASTGTRFDCGDKLGYLEAIVAVALHRDDQPGARRALCSAAC